MAERAAHLVDHVFPRVPVRQWVLSLPHRLRYRLAWDHALCRAVAGHTMRAILGFLRGLPTRIPEARPARSPPIPLLEGSTARVGPHELVYDHDEPA